jgi:DNA-directed RNA polymerase subunit alpha
MIFLPNLPKITNKKDNEAVFEISPLCSGYGMTLGNSFRRVLLSSLEGAAITEVKIEGANNEFSTLPNILEDVIIILINLKKIRFTSWAECPQSITLDIKGEKQVLAKDFKVSAELKIANPELYIATLTDKKAELKIEAKVEKGIGYLTVEEREEKKPEIGVIFLDAIFNPVKKVSFEIKNVIVGKKTDFEKLDLKIETDGTILPEEAFLRATDILLRHFSLFSEFEQEKKIEEKKEKKQKKEKKEKIVKAEKTPKPKKEKKK